MRRPSVVRHYRLHQLFPILCSFLKISSHELMGMRHAEDNESVIYGWPLMRKVRSGSLYHQAVFLNADPADFLRRRIYAHDHRAQLTVPTRQSPFEHHRILLLQALMMAEVDVWATK